MKKTIFIIILLLSGSVASAELTFSVMRHHDISDGISDNSVRSIIQDKTGYIWFGTKDGINRFNGDRFTSFGGFPRTKDNYLINVLKLYQHSDGHKIWIGAIDGLYIFDDHTEDFTMFSASAQGNRHPKSLVNDLCYDNDGNLWIASSEGLWSYNEVADSLKYHGFNVVLSLMKDTSGRIWIGTRQGLTYYNKSQDKFITFKWVKKSTDNTPYEINHMIETQNGEIWIGTRHDGLLCFDRSSGRFTRFDVSSNAGGNTWIRAIHEMSDRYLLIGSEDGLFTFDRKNEKVKHVRQFGKEAIYTFKTDHEGGIWIGTYFDGAYYISPQNGNLNIYQEKPHPGSLKGKAISQFCEDREGGIWIATEDSGLNYFDPAGNRFTNYSTISSCPPQAVSHNNIHALMLNGNDLWIGTFSKGIDIMDTESRTIKKRLRNGGRNPHSLPNNHIYSIYKSSDGNVYVGTMKGFCRWIDGTDRFEPYCQMSNIFVYDMIEDRFGKLWIATKNDGVICFDKGKFTSYTHASEDSTSISNNHVLRAHIDREGNLWFATEGSGICRYDYEKDAFINYDNTKKLYHHIIYGILDDTEGNLWLSSNYGIVKYNPTTYESVIYTHEDGLQSNQFNYRSSMRASDGRFYFGGIKGFNSFYPSGFHINRAAPPVVISGIVLHKKGSSERVKADERNRIIIGPEVTSFEISYDCLSYILPSKNRYAYMMDGLHDDWIYTDKPSVTLMDLPAGKYRFMIKGSNNDDSWSGISHIDITVKVPLWRSKAAIILYILLSIALCAAATLQYIRHLRKERDRDRQQMEMEMQQKVYRSQFQFFTHIAHEIKTPLTLIKAPLERILEEGQWSDNTHENLLVMQQNTGRLMELIKQLLDFRKIDKDGYRLYYTEVEIGEFIRNIVKRFGNSGRNITIHTRLPEHALKYNVDAEALSKIMSNLLANGLKYASSVIEIEASEQQGDSKKRIVISVADDGPGISENETKKIFEPFYRSDTSGSEGGFGIGLSLVKLLIDKLGGCISVGRSDRLGGFLATISIPQGVLTHDSSREQIRNADSERDIYPPVLTYERRSNVLIVDDTKEMLDFLIKNLGQPFRVYGAADGNEALTVIKKQAIDIIVSDIAMPNMDGFELLHAVRSDKMLCHIPFILLSAQDNISSKIAGLDYGADAYIEKPFSINYLKATIENLLKNRKVLFEKFANMPSLEYGKGEMKEHDIQWLGQITDIIRQNIRNEQFTIDTLASEMAVSRSSLRRKIVGLTGLAPNDYIRLVRLKLAAELLSNGKYRVNEVCYMIGFSNHSYFSRCFYKQFGVLPKDYASKV
jgi:ligand-binding sensor domain-containing protein/signal transduction histidine kinase/DNA-binding response OmpR family regulator